MIFKSRASKLGKWNPGNLIRKEVEMEKALMAVQILGGLGSFFTGIGIFWLATILKEKKQ
jgi:hypothetical protein